MITCNPAHLLPWIKAVTVLALVCIIQAAALLLCAVLPAVALLWAILLPR